MKKIAIFGAGGFGREVHMLIEQINAVNQEYEFIGYFDDGLTKGTIINGFPVLGAIAEINTYTSALSLVCAVGDPSTKRAIVGKIKNPMISYPTLIHPNVLIGNRQFNEIGEGCIICAGVIITVNTIIGNHVILNLACTVGHDTTIGNFSSFMPTVNISGEVIIEDAVYVGTGAKINNQLTIGTNTIVGSGAVVVKSLPAHCTAVGAPAKPIKYHL
jgi:sugar O-acyltransferase (sialic acid O-acetyltransferase NeuD family)